MKKVMSRVFAFTMGLLMMGGLLSELPSVVSAATTDTQFQRTAQEVVEDMGYGINLGNVMEACGTWINKSSVSNFETAWGAPITTKEMITGMKKAGFDSIRIPVSWSNMMDEKFTIDTAYLDRVEEIVNYALDNDMYVIVNDHYDSNWWKEFESQDTYKNAMKHYTTMWKQVIKRFKDYDERLIFESANEELQPEMGYDVINTINQTFVDLVRKSGGNNAKRYLLIAGVNTDIDKTCDSRYVMPTDTIENHLMISVHYYNPWTYCGLWKDESWGKMDSDWGTETDKNAMKTQLEKMLKFKDAGYAVVIGEYSVLPKYVNKGEYQRKGNDTDFLNYFNELCDEYGYATYLWNTEDWYDKATCTMRYSDIAEIFLPRVVKTENVLAGVRVTWKKMKEATQYRIYRNGTLIKKVSSQTSGVYVDKKAGTNGKKYTYTVQYYVGKKSAGNAKSFLYRVTRPTIKTATNVKTKKITVKYSKISKASGYEIRLVDGTNTKTVTVRSGSKVSVTVTGLTKGHVYSVSVRAYRRVKGVNYYSVWSKIKKVTIRK